MRKYILFYIIMLFSVYNIYSQDTDSQCKVLMETISESYKGDCKNGLADGYGTAIGKDFYVGMFKEGLPHGKGKYTYGNGNSFEGNWEKGIKQGKGKYKYYVDGTATIVKGYWQNDEYVVKQKPVQKETCRVTNLSCVDYFYYSIKKLDDSEKEIEISFEKLMSKYIPDGLEVTFSTGYMNQMNEKLIISDFSCPFSCNLDFIIKVANTYKQCNFSFNITEPGKYEVILLNN